MAAEPDADADAAAAQAKADLADIPKIPYARGLRLSGREIMRIAMLVATLALLLTMQQPCSQAVSSFVSGFDVGSAGSAGSAAGVAPTAVPKTLGHLPAGMTDEQMKTRVEQLRSGGSGAVEP